ncbi:MAG TPA: hypothetical protein VFD98_17150 [Terracidiphilus sp.]|jgi:hypothetical protein|nr:hypothetical protein [Terracidiphilus sp.]
MSVTAFPQSPSYPPGNPEVLPPEQERPDWLGITVGATFLAGAFLLISGKKRAGLVVTAAAAAVTFLDQKETIREWWNALPQYLDDAQRLLDQAQRTVDDLAATRDKVRAILNR